MQVRLWLDTLSVIVRVRRSSYGVKRSDDKGRHTELEMKKMMLNTIVTKRAMPLEPLHWIARRMKGECYLQMGDIFFIPV